MFTMPEQHGLFLAEMHGHGLVRLLLAYVMYADRMGDTAIQQNPKW